MPCSIRCAARARSSSRPRSWRWASRRAYNVGLSDANLSKIELCDLIQRHAPGFEVVTAEVGKDPDQRNYIVSNARIEGTGFKPAFGLDDGIAELVKGYQIVRRSQYANA